MAIIFSDDFTGTTIDTGKWTETDPEGIISQNNTLIFSGFSAISITTTIFQDMLKSVSYIASGVAVAQVNMTWSPTSNQENKAMFVLWKDNNNFAYISSRGPGGVYRLGIVSGGASVYELDASATVTITKDVKIWTDGTYIKWFYWNTNTWTQMGTTQTYSLGSNLYAIFGGQFNKVFTGATTVNYDNFYMSDADYSTQYPPTTAIKSINPTLLMMNVG